MIITQFQFFLGKDGTLKHLIGDCSASIRDSDEIPKQACQALIQHQCNIFFHLTQQHKMGQNSCGRWWVKCPIL